MGFRCLYHSSVGAPLTGGATKDTRHQFRTPVGHFFGATGLQTVLPFVAFPNFPLGLRSEEAQPRVRDAFFEYHLHTFRHYRVTESCLFLLVWRSHRLLRASPGLFGDEGVHGNGYGNKHLGGPWHDFSKNGPTVGALNAESTKRTFSQIY